MKEIDWEERHFQICLALIQGEATKPTTPSFPYQSIVKTADRMIDVLKKRVEQQTVEPAPAKGDNEQSDVKESPRKKSGGFCSPLVQKSKRSALYQKVWKALQESGHGFETGSDIPYFHLVEACENICDVDEINIDEFGEMFDVNIG